MDVGTGTTTVEQLSQIPVETFSDFCDAVKAMTRKRCPVDGRGYLKGWLNRYGGLLENSGNIEVVEIPQSHLYGALMQIICSEVALPERFSPVLENVFNLTVRH